MASVVLPLDSSPKISLTRPRGIPPIPMAASRLIAPVEMPLTRTCGASAPIRMMEPLPQVFSICVMARLSALRRSSEILVGCWVGWCAMIDLDMGGEPPGMRPEYIPKPISPPSRTEGVLQVLYLVVNNADTVKAIDVGLAPKPIHPDARHLHDLSPFPSRHRFERTAQPLSAADLHFDEGDETTAPGDEIDLDSTKPKPMRHDFPATALKIANRLFFTGQPSPIARVNPIRRIAVNPARHGDKLSLGQTRQQPHCYATEHTQT